MALFPRLFGSAVRAAARRQLLDKLAPEALGSHPIFSATLLCSSWRLRILESAICEGLGTVVWEIGVLSHRAIIGTVCGFVSCLWLWPYFSASSSWLACQASDASCSPRIESVVPIANKTDLWRWWLAVAAPQARALGYCRQEAAWALDNAKLSGAMRLSARCAHQLAPALAATEPSKNLPTWFLLQAARTLSSTPTIAVSTQEDLLSVSTWAKSQLLAQNKPRPVDARLLFWADRWLPPISLLGLGVFLVLGFLKGIIVWRREFLSHNSEEMSSFLDARRIEQACNAGRALADQSSSAPRKRPNRL